MTLLKMIYGKKSNKSLKQFNPVFQPGFLCLFAPSQYF